MSQSVWRRRARSLVGHVSKVNKVGVKEKKDYRLRPCHMSAGRERLKSQSINKGGLLPTNMGRVL